MSFIYESDNSKDNEKRKFQPDSEGNVAVNVKSKDIVDALEVIAENTGGGSGYQDTLQYSGSVGLTAVLLPSVPSGDIAQVIISCRVQTPSSKRLLFSLDGGVTFFSLSPGSMVGWEPKDITQIQLKGNAPSVDYDVLMNVRSP